MVSKKNSHVMAPPNAIKAIESGTRYLLCGRRDNSRPLNPAAIRMGPRPKAKILKARPKTRKAKASNWPKAKCLLMARAKISKPKTSKVKARSTRYRRKIPIWILPMDKARKAN